MFACARFLAIFAIFFALAACEGRLPGIKLARLGAEAPPVDFLGLIVGDEPQAVLAGLAVLRTGGNAADGAVTVALGLAATLPSRAGMDSGGVCLVYGSDTRTAEVVSFQPSALILGLSALHARYGRSKWAETVAPVEAMTRFGVRVSRALSRDLSQGGARLLQDGAVLGLFLNGRRELLTEGDAWSQPELASFLSAVRLRGPDAQAAGVSPQWQAAHHETSSDVDRFSLSPVTERDAESGTEKIGRSSFVIADRDGNVVACVLSMGRMFGDAHRVEGQVYLRADKSASSVAQATAVVQRSAEDRLTMAEVAGASGSEHVNGWRCANGLLSAPAACDVSVAFPGEGYAVMAAPDAPM